MKTNDTGPCSNCQSNLNRSNLSISNSRSSNVHARSPMNDRSGECHDVMTQSFRVFSEHVRTTQTPSHHEMGLLCDESARTQLGLTHAALLRSAPVDRPSKWLLQKQSEVSHVLQDVSMTSNTYFMQLVRTGNWSSVIFCSTAASYIPGFSAKLVYVSFSDCMHRQCMNYVYGSLLRTIFLLK
jgi:hypothetical protein